MLAMLLIALASRATRNSVSGRQPGGDDEPLAEQVTDPLSYLTQMQIKDPYTPAEYGTNAQPNTVQLRSIFAIRPFSFIPVEQLVRPTIKIVTVPNGKGASTTTAYDDMQLLDLFRDTVAELQGDRFALGNRTLSGVSDCVERPRWQ